MVESTSGQDEANLAFWLATQDGPILPAWNFLCSLFCHIINSLLTKLVQPRWLNIGLVLFCVLLTLDKELGQYTASAILTSRLVNIKLICVANRFLFSRPCYEASWLSEVRCFVESLILIKWMFINSCRWEVQVPWLSILTKKGLVLNWRIQMWEYQS